MKYEITLKLVVETEGPATKDEVGEALVANFNDRVYRRCPVAMTYGWDGNDELTEIFIYGAEEML